MLAGTKVAVGVGHATVFSDFDFETYSEAGLQLVADMVEISLENTKMKDLEYKEDKTVDFITGLNDKFNKRKYRK